MLNLVPTEHWDYGTGDMMRGLLAAVLPPRKGTDPYIAIPGVGQSLPIRSARAAIVLALKALGSRPGALVAVPLYCCPVVLRAIAEAGCRARFIDIDPETYCMSPTDLAAKSSEVDAVIAVHMFGNMCDIPTLRQAAPEKPFIEDCAQALGSRFGGRAAGSFGEIAVFSFRSGKYVSAGEGGAVYCGQPDLKSRVSKLIRELPIPSRVDECVHVVKTYLRSLLRSKPLWGLIGSRLWTAYSAKVSITSQAAIVLGQIYETDRDTTLRRLPLLGPWIEKQRSNALHYAENLSVDAEILCSEAPGAFFNRLQYPLLLPTSDQCERLAQRLREKQISTARPYRDIAEIAATHYGYTGDSPRAERVAKTVLVIPCSHSISAADVKRITRCVNLAWAEIGNRRPRSAAPHISTDAADARQSGRFANPNVGPPSDLTTAKCTAMEEPGLRTYNSQFTTGTNSSQAR
jgi:perosamine synthetase